MTVGPGETAKRTFGGIQLINVSGNVFRDNNRNGIRDSGEAGVAGWLVILYGGSTETGFSYKLSVLTDANGDFRFTDVVPIQMRVAALSSTNYITTEPRTGFYKFRPSSRDIDGLLFGLKRLRV